MSEYTSVEKPFLEKLIELGWKPVVDHGAKGIPQNPKTSYRTSFRDVILESIFKERLREINLTEDGKQWLTDKQVNNIFDELNGVTGKSLLEINKEVHSLLIKGRTVDKNELTGEIDAKVKFIDFKNEKNNSFIAINQFRLDTPGGTKKMIIPDIVLFLNGLPLIVVECKDEDCSEPLSEAESQIRRYSNRRGSEERIGVKEGEERLFYYNLFSIITFRKDARFGSITSDFEYYYNWRDIFPEEYKTIDITKENDIEQPVLIHGMLNHEILLDVLKHFTIFMEIKKGTEVKVVCRYQQYRAVGKIIDRMRTGKSPDEKSGVIWHTQGSGKSLTMVFLVRKLRSQEDLKKLKILMVNDRTDLEEQLGETAELTDETVHYINNRRDLKAKLSNNVSNLNMVMVHKFLQEEIKVAKALEKALKKDQHVPEFKAFEEINTSEDILILIDEAHRTQSSEMGQNIFEAFPKSTKIAFTGTPLLTDRHKRKTFDRFGKPIDEYKLKQAVKDRATVKIIYEGRTSSDELSDSEEFENKFIDMFKKRTPEEIAYIKKKYGTLGDVLEAPKRIDEISEDLANHYVDEILVNGFKAQVVSNSILGACRYKFSIEKAFKRRLEVELEKAGSERNEDIIQKLEFIKVAAVVSSSDNNEDAEITVCRNQAKEWDAIENFKKDIDFEKPLTGVSVLCVCDKLLTGFDAPIEQVMYMDKNMREHDLLQAIARVNRTKQNKSYGLVVDYYGVAQHLRDALAIYASEDIDEFLDSFTDIKKEIPVLEARYKRLIQLFEDKGIKEIEDFVQQRTTGDKEKEYDLAEKCIALADEIRFRAEFTTFLKAFYESMDMLFNVPEIKEYYIPSKRFAYLMMRMRNRFKDDTMDLKWAGEKVKRLIDEYLESQNISRKIPPVEILSDEFYEELDKHTKTPKAKASDMEHAIRKHIKVNWQDDPGLYDKLKDKLEAILERHANDWAQQVAELDRLRAEMKEGRSSEDGMDVIELPFYDIVLMNSFKDQELSEIQKEKVKAIVIEVVDELQQTIGIIDFWSPAKAAEVKKLEGKINEILDFSDLPEIMVNYHKITTEILTLAKRRHDNLLAGK